MRQFRSWVPILGILNLLLLFFQMPEAPNLFGLLGCKTCASSDPFLLLIGAGYFATIISISLLYPSFPNRQMACGGLIWALFLASGLTYLHLPNLCPACLIGHFLNLMIWTIWLVEPSPQREPPSFFKERIFFLFLTPMIVVTLFSCLNITFLIYHFQDQQDLSTVAYFKSGDRTPPFNIQTTKGNKINHDNLTQSLGIVINFVTANCPYCIQQLSILNDVAMKLSQSSYQFVNVSSALTDDLIQRALATEWAEDKEGELHHLFKVKAYPTTFIIGNDGKIKQVILGVPENFETSLLTSILKAS